MSPKHPKVRFVERRLMMKSKVLAIAICSFFIAGLGVCFAADMIYIGVNAPLTGDIPKVGEGTKFAAQMWLEDVNAAGGIKVGGKQYKVELVIEDNESKAESAVKANTKLITEEDVLAIDDFLSDLINISAPFCHNYYACSFSFTSIFLEDCSYIYKSRFLLRHQNNFSTHCESHI